MTVSLTSILGTDLISASRAVINTNLDNLNTGKADLTSPSFLGVPNAPTATYGNSSKQIATTEYVQQSISSVMNSGLTSVLTTVPKPVAGLAGTPISIQTLGNNQAIISLMNIPNPINVSQVALEVTSVKSGGLKFAMYYEGGQSSVFTTGTEALVTNGTYVCSLASAKLVNPGNYWFAWCDTNNDQNEYRSWIANPIYNQWASVAGKAVLNGTMSILTGTLPASFNPVTGVSSVLQIGPITRFD